jgi:hypothetical protein
MNEEEIFHQALSRSRPEERAAYLESAAVLRPSGRSSTMSPALVPNLLKRYSDCRRLRRHGRNGCASRPLNETNTAPGLICQIIS